MMKTKHAHVTRLAQTSSQHSSAHSSTQVLPITLLVLPRCLMAAQPENVSPISVIMSQFFVKLTVHVSPWLQSMILLKPDCWRQSGSVWKGRQNPGSLIT